MHLFDCSFLSWRVRQAYLADQAYAERYASLLDSLSDGLET